MYVERQTHIAAPAMPGFQNRSKNTSMPTYIYVVLALIAHEVCNNITG
jgi:hypothetical protein